MAIDRDDLLDWRKQRLIGTMEYLRGQLNSGAGYLIGGNGAGFVAIATTIAAPEWKNAKCLPEALDGFLCALEGWVAAAALISFVLGFAIGIGSKMYLTQFIDEERKWRVAEIERYLGDSTITFTPEDFEREPPNQEAVTRFLKVSIALSIGFFLLGLVLLLGILLAKAL